jgi:hypothetical protein
MVDKLADLLHRRVRSAMAAAGFACAGDGFRRDIVDGGWLTVVVDELPRESGTITFQVVMSVVTTPFAARMSATGRRRSGHWHGAGLLDYRFVPPVQVAHLQPGRYEEQAQVTRRDRLVGFGLPAHVLTRQEWEAGRLKSAAWGFPAAGGGAEEACGRALEAVVRNRILPLATELGESRDRLRAEARSPGQYPMIECIPGQSGAARREVLVVLDYAPVAEVERLLADVEEYSPRDQFISWARERIEARAQTNSGRVRLQRGWPLNVDTLGF